MFHTTHQPPSMHFHWRHRIKFINFNIQDLVIFPIQETNIVVLLHFTFLFFLSRRPSSSSVYPPIEENPCALPARYVFPRPWFLLERHSSLALLLAGSCMHSLTLMCQLALVPSWTKTTSFFFIGYCFCFGPRLPPPVPGPTVR